MPTKTRPRPARAQFAWALFTFAVAVLLVGTQPISAAKPPNGKTYFTALVGVGAAYDIQHQCFEFTGEDFCSLGGEFCGSWQRTESPGPASSFSFQLSFLENGVPVTLDGHATVEGTGPRSSIGGAGSQLERGRRSNFSFVGREASPEQCRELLVQSPDDDDGETIVGSGNLDTESRDVADFDAVSLAGVGRLIIEHTGTESLTVTADDNILPLLTSAVVGGQLQLASEGRFSTQNQITYRLTVSELDEILVSGAAGVESTDIDTDVLRLTLAGASAAKLGGAVDRQIVSLSGACAYDGADLDSRVATVNLVGASAAVVRVRELLEGTVAGVSLLEYFGSPTVNVTVVGAGRVVRRGN